MQVNAFTQAPPRQSNPAAPSKVPRTYKNHMPPCCLPGSLKGMPPTMMRPPKALQQQERP